MGTTAEHVTTPLPPELSGKSAIEDLLRRAQSAPTPVIVLTDEELASLGSGPGTSTLAPSPWLSLQDEGNRKLMCAVAMRGLVARGIARPLPGAPPDGAEGTVVAVHQDLRGVLTMRGTAGAVVLAEQRAGEEHRIRVLYLGWGGVLAEDVSADGMHGFTVMSRAAAAEGLAVFAAPLEREPMTAPGPARTISLSEIARGAATGIDQAHSVTVIGRLSLSPEDEVEEERLTVYALIDHVVVTEPASDTGREGALTLTPAGKAELQERLTRLLELDRT